VDDRVRGGSSTSHLEEIRRQNAVRFHGHLDTKTLGGAGFASQTTTGDIVWNLATYDGLLLDVVKGDGKMYTIIVKDDVPEQKRDDGREFSSLSWEYDFKGEGAEKLHVPWSDFKATYRGREKKDAEPLKMGEIKRFSLMMRSFFDTQEGDFELFLAAISAVKKEASK
jgi:hypothetical protein